MTVDVSKDERIAIISINRPQVHNAKNEISAISTGLSEHQAITNETIKGIAVLKSVATVRGASRLAEGAEHHGEFH